MNQPRSLSEEDRKISLDNEDLFDPPRQRVDKPLLEAAYKAAEQRRRQEDILNGTPYHLAGMHQPRRINNYETKSIDSHELFDDEEEDRDFSPGKPLLEAALLQFQTEQVSALRWLD